MTSASPTYAPAAADTLLSNVEFSPVSGELVPAPAAPAGGPRAAGPAVPDDPGARAVAAVRERQVTPEEEAFCRAWMIYRNATRAYRESRGPTNASRAAIQARASELYHRAAVQRRLAELERAAAASVVIDYAAILRDDLRIIEGARHAHELSWFVWEACRYCHGVEHQYQWIDAQEWAQESARIIEANALIDSGATRGKRMSVPDSAGGFGFQPTAKPHPECPKCAGRGEQRAVIADTEDLSGPARAYFRGIKQTTAGFEVLTQDVDKAKERVLRAGGIFKDDAASVARGAAAGAAAGAAMARRIEDHMTPEEAARLYLEISQ